MPTHGKIVVFDDPEKLARSAAEKFVELARESIRDQGRFSIALAGGSTPARVYELLGSELKDQIDWARVHLFFGDERPVPPDHPDSNYRMAHEKLISRVPIPAENVHRIIGEAAPEESAKAYEEELRRHFSREAWPLFDLVYLGLGDDGHTASLFPGTEGLREEHLWVIPNRVDKLNTHRITLTAPALNHSTHIIFLVTGGQKADCLREVLEGSFDPARLPAQLIRPEEGKLEWFVDRDAARLLNQVRSDQQFT